MASGIKIKGLDQLVKKLEKVDDVIRNDVNDVVVAGAYEMNSQAQRNINSQGIIDKGRLIASQQVVSRIADRMMLVINDAPYAPYHEFGTGGMVRVPPDWEEIALQFKGKGVRVVNIRPRPFLVPAFNQVAPKIVQDVEDVINDALK